MKKVSDKFIENRTQELMIKARMLYLSIQFKKLQDEKNKMKIRLTKISYLNKISDLKKVS